MRTTKPFILAPLFILLLMTAGCGDLATFPVTVDIPEQVVEASPLGTIGELLPRDLFDPFTVDMSQEEEFKKQDVKHIESLKLSRLRLNLKPQSEQRNFDFFDSITVNAHSRDGSRTVQVATLSPVPKGLETLQFKVSGKELRDVVGIDFKLAFDVRGRAPAKKAHFDGDATFTVEAKLF
jgi:hypothetical protein